MRFRGIGLCVVLFLGTTAMAAPLSYTLKNLGTLGGTDSFGYALNDAGQVVGNSAGSIGNLENAYETRANAAIAVLTDDLGTLGDGNVSYAYGVNASGQVVGNSKFHYSDPNVHAYRTLVGQPITAASDLGTLGGYSSYGRGINATGQVAGYSQITAGSSTYHAFREDGNTMVNLGTLGGTNSYGYGINNNGQVAGYSAISATDSNYHAFRTAASVITSASDLGTLGGKNSYGRAVNNLGQVAGYSQISLTDSNTHAFLTDANATIGASVHPDLGTLGGANSQAYGLNDSGWVVGGSQYVIGNSTYHAFVYDGTTMYDLNAAIPGLDPNWVLNYAYEINSSGQIAGYGQYKGVNTAFLLSPVSSPEPLTLVILAGGTVAELLRRRRKS